MVLDKLDVKEDFCLDPKAGRISNRKLGVELMRTFQTTYCFALLRNKLFDEKSISHVNNIQRSVSEIIDAPMVCVGDGDFKVVECWNMNFQNDDLLYK